MALKMSHHVLSCRISKGDGIFIPILAINVAKSIWGEDAETFKYVALKLLVCAVTDLFSDSPDRWFNVPEAAKDIPGVWGHMLTFLGGARSCIGYRFALYEYVVSLCMPFSVAQAKSFMFHSAQNEGAPFRTAEDVRVRAFITG